MPNARLLRTALLAMAAVAIALVATPYLRQHFFAATAPRTIEPRGELASFERSTIELFERSSPGVVQVVSQRQNSGGSMSSEPRGPAWALEPALCGIAPAISSPMLTSLRVRSELPCERHPGESLLPRRSVLQ
jgi:hypothetical protein